MIVFTKYIRRHWKRFHLYVSLIKFKYLNNNYNNNNEFNNIRYRKKNQYDAKKRNLFFIKLKFNSSWIGYAWINACTTYLTTNKIKQNSIPFIIIYHLQ